MKKLLAIGIIFLFIGVAVAPSINSTVVKTSDNLIEVTSQACGIQGFGNTTVKLTKQQYHDLEQYLVDFRARLNRTTTKDEAIPIFKDAVVELNKYGLLPKGMSVEKAQKLVIGPPLSSRKMNNLQELLKNNRNDNATNYFCTVTVSTTPWPNTANINLIFLVGGLVSAIGLGLTFIGWAPPAYLGPFALIGVPILILGLILLSYSQFRPFLPFCIFIFIFSNANYSTSGLLGLKQGFSPGGMSIGGFVGFEIISKTKAMFLGWAVHTQGF
jgi:hypothetical protein